MIAVILVFVVLFMIVVTVYERNIIKSKNISSNIYSVVKEAFITDKGYSGEVTEHMTRAVFDEINAYSIYKGDKSTEYKKPFKVDFTLKEDSQTLITGILVVKMTYSVEVKDSENMSIGGSWNIPITFTIKIIGDKWYILDKREPA